MIEEMVQASDKVGGGRQGISGELFWHLIHICFLKCAIKSKDFKQVKQKARRWLKSLTLSMLCFSTARLCIFKNNKLHGLTV